MKYFKFKMPSEEEKEIPQTPMHESLFDWLLEKLIPKANPDFGTKYNDVDTWFVEYDEENDCTNREIGLNRDGHIIVKGPFNNNLGYWVDNDLSLQDYEDDFDIQYINKDVFEELWEDEITGTDLK